MKKKIILFTVIATALMVVSCGHDEQECEACVGMNDMLDGCACDEGERYCPDVERKVFDANNAAMEARSIVFDDVCKQHGHDEHEEHLVEDFQECSHERHVGRGIHNWEENGHHQRAEKVREERVSGHGLEIAAELCRHDSSRSRCGSYDARKKAFGKYEGVSRRAQSHNQPDDNADYYELLNTNLYARVKAGVDYRTQMQQIKACGYMTSSTEVNSVINLIQKYNLTRFDHI